jgi:hypothetical protein
LPVGGEVFPTATEFVGVGNAMVEFNPRAGSDLHWVIHRAASRFPPKPIIPMRLQFKFIPRPQLRRRGLGAEGVERRAAIKVGVIRDSAIDNAIRFPVEKRQKFTAFSNARLSGLPHNSKNH